MNDKFQKIKIFSGQNIRTAWNEDEEEWYFSVVDVVGVLTEQKSLRGASNYWAKLKQRLKEEGDDQLLTNCQQLKMISPKDGKSYLTDIADTEEILRIIESIPSKKAEPFKRWLAKVGSERLNEIADPEIAILRGADYYRKKGYTEGWINQRLQTIEMRKELTDEWKRCGVEKEKDFAILTDEMTKEWSGLSVRNYKKLKFIKKENLRDNMTNIELALNMLAEVSTTAISKKVNPKDMQENRNVAKRGGNIARNARVNLEKQLGMSVISKLNAKNKKGLEVKR